jgi:hypothetical protein
MANPVFRKESLNKISSPEQLDDYIKVSNMGVWMIIAAAIIIIAAVLVWGIVGQLQTVVNVSGIAQNGVVTCYLPDVSSIETGDSVEIGDIAGTVTDIAEKPMSQESINALYDEFTVYSLGLYDWNYAVTVSAPGVSDGIVAVELITDSVSPISFIWD